VPLLQPRIYVPVPRPAISVRTLRSNRRKATFLPFAWTYLLRWASPRPLNDIGRTQEKKGAIPSPPGAEKPIKTTPSADTKIRYVVIPICEMRFGPAAWPIRTGGALFGG
jgi:hypothetical protein